MKRRSIAAVLAAIAGPLAWAAVAAWAGCPAALGAAAGPIHVGSRLELFVDDYLVERLVVGAQLRLQHPVPREVAVVFDSPWEGNGCGYHTVFRDGDLYRLYYRGLDMGLRKGKVVQPHPWVTCYAQSKDGVHWTKPELGLVSFAGSKKNNILWEGPESHNFTPFRDDNPAATPEARYKAVGLGQGGLRAFKSPDGIRWSPLADKPVITQGAFDSQNLAFWDPLRKEYRAYFRDFRQGRRDIRTATSKDFLTWSDPVWLEYPGAPKEQLYTNQVKPYFRAPHLFLGFPTRYLDRGWSDSMKALPDAENRQSRARANRRYGTALTEGLLMSSRDGVTFHRWPEAFLRPGPQRKGSWAYGDSYIAWQAVETRATLPSAPSELSIYASEGYWTGAPCQLRRYTLRLDGFASVWAPMGGGELVTRPLVFDGNRLVLNFSTSAAGSIRVEVQDASGQPLDGFALADCPEVFGDAIERVVSWKGGSDLKSLAGRPIRLRFLLKDADLYSLRFK